MQLNAYSAKQNLPFSVCGSRVLGVHFEVRVSILRNRILIYKNKHSNNNNNNNTNIIIEIIVIVI